MQREYVYRAFDLMRVVDGDTLFFSLDLGMGIKYEEIYGRFLTIDTPENVTEAGKLVTRLLYTLMCRHKFSLISLEKPEKYGRATIDVVFDRAPIQSWSQACLLYKFAKPYQGGKKSWVREELDAVCSAVTSSCQIWRIDLLPFSSNLTILQ